MAGVSTKEIKTRIRSMESTKQITKAMEMVAASKLRHAQAKIAHSRPYFQLLYGVIQDIARLNTEQKLPYLQPVQNSEDRIAYVVIAGDRGLAGGYNSNILKMVYQDMAGRDVDVLPIGKKAADFFHLRGVPLLNEQYTNAEDVSVSDCFTMAKALCKAFKAGKYSEIRLGYSNFVSALSQTPATIELLPLSALDNDPTDEGEGILYEPGRRVVFEAIIPEYLGGVIYGALCESRASEQAARRSAMDTATQNAEEMIADLSLKFNQARQAAITQEITEIVAGT